MPSNNVYCVIGIYQRPRYLEELLHVLSRQLPKGRICISDDASDNRELTIMLDYAKGTGYHVQSYREHRFLVPVWNDGIRWAIDRGAEVIIAMEDAIVPAANLVEELTATLLENESVWMAHPLITRTGPEPTEPHPQYGKNTIFSPTEPPPKIYTNYQAEAVAEFLAAVNVLAEPRWWKHNWADSTCWAMKRKCWETVGLPDEGSPQGWGTNSIYINDMMRAGGELAICERTAIIHHCDDWFETNMPGFKQQWMSMGEQWLASLPNERKISPLI